MLKFPAYFDVCLHLYIPSIMVALKYYVIFTGISEWPVDLKKKKYTSSLYYFDKRSTFEAHFVKLN